MHAKGGPCASIAWWVESLSEAFPLHHAFFLFSCYRVPPIITTYLSIAAYSNKPNCVGIIATSDGSLLMQEDHQRREPKHSESTGPARAIIAWAYNYKGRWWWFYGFEKNRWRWSRYPSLFLYSITKNISWMRSHTTVSTLIPLIETSSSQPNGWIGKAKSVSSSRNKLVRNKPAQSINRAEQTMRCNSK